MTTYICSICRENKLETDFYTYKSGYRRKQCNVCRRLYASNHKNEYMKQQREFKKDNPKTIILWGAKGRANKYNLPFNIDESDIVIPNYCPILGLKLERNIGGKTASENSPTLDRIIPELGYVKGNVMVISKRANTIKSYGTIEEHERVIEYMKRCQNK